jgi:hypothetical protein
VEQQRELARSRRKLIKHQNNTHSPIVAICDKLLLKSFTSVLKFFSEALSIWPIQTKFTLCKTRFQKDARFSFVQVPVLVWQSVGNTLNILIIEINFMFSQRHVFCLFPNFLSPESKTQALTRERNISFCCAFLSVWCGVVVFLF